MIASCCMEGKCNLEPGSSKFRIVSSLNGHDLLFGPTRIYNKDSIKFFSLNGTDTVFHSVGGGVNNYPDMDSVLYVNFDYTHKDTVYVYLNNSIIDTLKLRYQIIDQSRCCPGYSDITSYNYNGMELPVLTGGIITIKK